MNNTANTRTTPNIIDNFKKNSFDNASNHSIKVSLNRLATKKLFRQLFTNKRTSREHIRSKTHIKIHYKTLIYRPKVSDSNITRQAILIKLIIGTRTITAIPRICKLLATFGTNTNITLSMTTPSNNLSNSKIRQKSRLVKTSSVIEMFIIKQS